ncbi:DUF6891 domain-containing protein [Streptomyces sp. NRRL WC-3549]|uniref:DUF6891 domain-containing protein n=1 Tax=Streptomyces sp. NRRL WC-3549 TaxID=1463925 RepID=UPI0004CB04DC|nr:hypothetical protein [Streptomyces sp. NRRL WC-3549]
MIDGSDRERLERGIQGLRSSGWTIAAEARTADGNPVMAITSDLDQYFDDEGGLIRDLPFWWAGGMPSRIQVVFARQDLCVTLGLDSDEGDGNIMAARAGQSDVCRLVRAFAALEEIGYLAEPDFAYTNSSGWSDVHERRTEPTQAVFWNSQAHLDCFDDEGMLIDDLPLQWAGDPDVIAATLRESGLVIEVPQVSEMVFYVCPEDEDTALPEGRGIA